MQKGCIIKMKDEKVMLKTQIDVSGAKNMQECVSMFLKEEIPEHLKGNEKQKWESQEQAQAAAYSYCKKKGFKDTTIGSYQELIPVLITKVTDSGDYIYANVTAVAEMVQDYHITELWWMMDLFPEDSEYLPILKDAEELRKSAAELKIRETINGKGIDKIPFVIPHTHGSFLKSQAPKDVVEQMDMFVVDEDIKGWFQDITFDTTNKKIKGKIAIDKKKCSKEVVNDILAGKPISVSIGFICDFDIKSGDLKGKPYFAIQRNIRLGHLAGILEGSGKCPIGTCGINQDKLIHPKLMELLNLLPEKKIMLNNVDKTEPTKPQIIPTPSNTMVVKNDLHHITTTEVLKMPTEEELKLENARLQKQLADMQGSVSDAKYKELEKQFNDLQTKIGANTALASKIQSDLDAKEKELKEAKDKLKGIEDKEGDENRRWIGEKVGGMDKIVPNVNKPAKDLCNHDAKVARGSIEAMLDFLLVQQKGVQKGAPDQHDQNAKADLNNKSGIPIIPDE